MDYIRSAYVVNMQFDVAGTIIVPIRWYACEPTATEFPGPHAFGSQHTWQEHQLPALGIGERWDSKPTYYNGAPPFFAPGNGSFCGELIWYQEGVPSFAPPIEYSGQGVPVCCPQPPCQPWYEASTGHRVVTSVNPNVVWLVDTEDSTLLIVVDAPTEENSIQLDAFGAGFCQGTDNTEVNGSFPLLGAPFQMVLQSYNQATFTGTWVPVAGAAAPPGFKIFFKCPPT